MGCAIDPAVGAAIDGVMGAAIGGAMAAAVGGVVWGVMTWNGIEPRKNIVHEFYFSCSASLCATLRQPNNCYQCDRHWQGAT